MFAQGLSELGDGTRGTGKRRTEALGGTGTTAGLVPTLILLQPADLAQDGLQVHVEAVAAAEQLQEVAGAQRAARVVDELPGRGQPVRQDLKLLTLCGRRGTSAPERKML